MEIKTPDVVIHIDPDRAALIETQVIDGRKCIVIPMEGDVEINGIHVSSGNSESTESQDFQTISPRKCEGLLHVIYS